MKILKREVEKVLCSGNYGNEENDEIHKAVITNLNKLPGDKITLEEFDDMFQEILKNEI
jgi:hypothetical protein